ncbi:MAG: WG repeat-containing protein, partial [Planctomycetota bacterium]|nr:WG repeat-containing protein [Planctomycetota bacterium]
MMTTPNRIVLSVSFLLAMLGLAAAQQWNAAPEQDQQKNLDAAWDRATLIYHTELKAGETAVSNLTDIPADETRRSRLSFSDVVVRSEYSQDLKVKLVKSSTDDEVSEIVEGEQWTGWAELRRLPDDPDYRIVADEEGLVFVVEGMGDTHLEAVARATIEAAACIRVHVRSVLDKETHSKIWSDRDGEVVEEDWSEITRTVGSQTAFQAIKGTRVLSIKPYKREGPPFIARVEITPGVVLKRDMRHRLPFLGRLTVSASVRGFTERPYYGHWDTIDEWKTRRLTQEKDAYHPEGFKIQDIDLATIGLEIHEAEEIPQSITLKLGGKEIPLRLVWFSRETLNAGYHGTLDLAEYKKENTVETLPFEVSATINGRDLDSKPETIAFRHEETTATDAYEPGPDKNHSLRIIYDGKREPARIELSPQTAATFAGADDPVEFTVRVQDDAGRPLEKIELAVRIDRSEADYMEPDRFAEHCGLVEPKQLVTDPEGRARFTYLPGKRGQKKISITLDHAAFRGRKRPFAHVTVEPPQYSFVDGPIKARTGDEIKLRGRVLAAKTGKPLAGTVVIFTLGPARPRLFEFGTEGWTATRTDETGTAEMAVTLGDRTGIQDVGFGTFTDYRDSEAKTEVTIAESEHKTAPEDEPPIDEPLDEEDVAPLLPLPLDGRLSEDIEPASHADEIDPRLLALDRGKRKKLLEEIDEEARFVSNEARRLARRWNSFPCRQTMLAVNWLVSKNPKAENYRVCLIHVKEVHEWVRKFFLAPSEDAAREVVVFIDQLQSSGGYVTRDYRRIIPGIMDEEIRSWDDADKLWAISRLRRELREFRTREQAVWRLAHEHLRVLAEYASLLDAPGAAAGDAMDAELKAKFDDLERQEKEIFEGISARLTPVFKGFPRALCDRLTILEESKDAYLPARKVEQCLPISDRNKAVRVERRWGIVDNSSRIIVEPRYDVVEKFIDGVAQFRLGRKWGFMNEHGRVVEPKFDEHLLFSQGRALIRSGDKFGYLDLDGNMAIPAQFDSAGRFSNGLAKIGMFKKDSFDWLFGFIDRRGRVVIAPQFRRVEDFSGGLAWAELEEAEDKVWTGFINRSGAKALNITKSEDDIEFDAFSDGMVAVRVRVTTAGPPEEWEWSSTTSRDGKTTRIGGKMKWGYMDTSGNILSPQYDEADKFADGVARVKIGEKYGLINKNGDYVIGPMELIGEFSEGLVPVMSGELWGYADRTGAMVIAPQFSFARPFEDELAEVTVGNNRFYIEKTGKLWLPQF